jgi:hypothetical protein
LIAPKKNATYEGDRPKVERTHTYKRLMSL